MALVGFNNSRTVRRKTSFLQKKLQINQRVEVRSFEEGFLGSWHPGTVIHCEKLKRHVKYENILDDNGLDHLVEVVRVSKALDGEFCSSGKRGGVIRPVPPLVEFEKCDLKFGLCVDVNYLEAWWEGVIYDQGDGMEERNVFFPDLGDEMKVRILQMRITQDWDEVTEKWERRGNWVFLDLIKECERGSFLPVSVKQIWYDVRQKKDFTAIGNWTLNVKKDLWRDMIMEVVGDYMAITIQEAFSVWKLPELDSVELISNLDSNKTLSEKKIFEQKEPVVLPAEKGLPEFQNEVSCNGDGEEAVSAAICFESSTSSKLTKYKRLIFSETVYCPDALNQYMRVFSRKKTMSSLKEKVWKHLAYLGWEIDQYDNIYGIHYRYKPPTGIHCKKKYYYSILEICELFLQMESMVKSSPSKNDCRKTHPTGDCHVPHVPLNPLEKIPNQDISHPVEVPPSVAVADEQAPPSIVVANEQAYCPQAIVEYHKRAHDKGWKDKHQCILKVRNHLLEEGWAFIDPPPNDRKRGFVYCSPQEKRFNSLVKACRFYIQERVSKSTIYGMQPLNTSSHLLPKKPELHTMDTVSPNRLSANRKRKHLRNSNDRLLECQSKGSTLRVLRSNKRVRTMSSLCPSHQKPLNVLSWLIDSNMVLPRSKVFYRAKRGNRVMAVGRITHEGIKCNCCQKIYNMVSFEFHAIDGNTSRPSACIFLDDGRSLLSIQKQIMQNHKARDIMVKTPLSDLCKGENDYICSVCHYGGQLLLCDQCPSSYHKKCLGLEDVPDGDWFCPSCRCGICGQSRFNGGDQDGNFLKCIQCEHKYHVVCLMNRDTSKSGSYVESQFCGKECEKLYTGLQSLLGMPFSVGVDNLTWRLVKFIDSESCDLDDSKNGLLAECYSKLNVALSLMHECFEPLKESPSSKDLMEDVIFSRRSELNRMNFRGFYVVLLERNEDLVTVATVRIFGDKVAEVPLVGTRFQYRRQGMCHILLDELEKKLKQLGVKQLVLPAVPSVVETWTGSFGFSKMTKFERSQFLNYTFLDFPGTIMCQKLLAKIPSPNSVLPIEFQQKKDTAISESSSDNKSPVSEVYQAGEIDKREMVDQQMLDTSEGDNDNLGSDVIDCVPKVDQPSPKEQQHCENGTSAKCTFEKWKGLCYSRRRKGKGLRTEA